MAFKIRRVGHLVLRVKEVERSRRFFTEILNLPVVAENERGLVFFSADVKDNHHMLAIMQAQDGATMPTPDHVGMQHISHRKSTYDDCQKPQMPCAALRAIAAT